MKNTILFCLRKIDFLLGGLLSRLHHFLNGTSEGKYIQRFSLCFSNSYTVYYQKNLSCVLSELCDKYGSDKGEIVKFGHPYPWTPHTYADFYSRIFGTYRLHIKKVFECGLGTNTPTIPSNMGITGKPGASLRVWRDYFPNAIVFGADIDQDVLFEEERIKTFYVDQTCPRSINKLWQSVEIDDFDLILDDGLHTFEAGICMFENSISKLSQNGIYVIEDVGFSSLFKFKDYFSNKKYNVDFVNLFRNDIGLGDNSLIIVRLIN